MLMSKNEMKIQTILKWILFFGGVILVSPTSVKAVSEFQANGNVDTSNKIVYYGVTPSSGFIDDQDDDFRNFGSSLTADVCERGQTGAETTDCQTNGMIRIAVKNSVDLDPPSGSELYLVILGGDGGDEEVPIYSYRRGYSDIPTTDQNDSGNIMVTCDDSNCLRRSEDSSEHYYAVKVNNNEVTTVGIYLNDICDANNDNDILDNVFDSECSGSGTNTPTSPVGTSATVFELKPVFRIISDSSKSDTAATGSTDTGTQYDFSFHGTPPLLSECETDGIYFPGDKEIFFQQNRVPVSTQTGSAPIQDLIIIGQRDGGFVPTDNTYPDNIDTNEGDIKSKIAYTEKEVTIGGFWNTSNGSDNIYDLYVTVRDKAGLAATWSANCLVNDVQTSVIDGFLNESDCFIATAVIQEDSTTLKLLRAFRDEFLVNYSWGRSFRDWYYDWSPDAARWLVRHPDFRLPVMVFLLPLVGVAWLILNPFFFGVVFLFGLTGFYFLSARRKTWRTQAMTTMKGLGE